MRNIRNSFKRPKVHNSLGPDDTNPSEGWEEVKDDEKKSEDIKRSQVADVQRSTTYPHYQGGETRTSNVKKVRRMTDGPSSQTNRVAPATGSRYKGPRSGQEYEMVNRKIINTNPDKTVELSTWRVQNEKIVRPEDAERISVHYVSGEEVKEELGQNVHVEWRFAETDNVIPVNQPLHSAAVRKGENMSSGVCAFSLG